MSAAGRDRTILGAIVFLWSCIAIALLIKHGGFL